MRAQQAQADIPVVTHDDLRWADGIAFRYGNMSAQMKQFVDTTGGLWLKPRATSEVALLASRAASRTSE